MSPGLARSHMGHGPLVISERILSGLAGCWRPLSVSRPHTHTHTRARTRAGQVDGGHTIPCMMSGGEVVAEMVVVVVVVGLRVVVRASR